jgi:peptide/nickel transport system ATP-binding protein
VSLADCGRGPAEPVLIVDDLHTYFESRAGMLKAVNGVSLRVRRGEVLGLVGESGAGKSVTALSILGLIDRPGRIVSGRILFEGRDLVRCPEKQLRKLRGGRIAMIFQDPMATLNPVLRIDTQMIETIRAHHPEISYAQARARVSEVLAQVGLPSPEELLKAYPHQYSGGMRQRVAIAIAFLNRPALIIADEPTTALDVTIQAQILYEIQSLCRELETAIIWITHDLALIAGLADTIAVMYAGKIVERGPVDAVLNRPLHPYTYGLIASIPSHQRRGTPLPQIPGMMPPPFKLPEGCGFRDRCRFASSRCLEVPALEQVAPDRWVRCFHPCVEAPR